MSSLPPPGSSPLPPPGQPRPQNSRHRRPPVAGPPLNGANATPDSAADGKWYQKIQPWIAKHPWAFIAIIVVPAIAVGALTGQFRKDGSNSSSSDPSALDLIVPVWNKLSAKEQFDLCAGVDTFGADWAANKIQESSGLLSRDDHNDIVWFLEEQACA